MKNNSFKPIKFDHNDPILVDAYKKVEEFLESSLTLNNISNFIFSITYMDEIVWSKTFGNIHPTIDGQGPLTLDTNFRIASITKLFTSLAMLQLRDNGYIKSIDENIQNYYKEFKINDIDSNNKPINGTVTFRQLATHTSGLPRETPCNPINYGTCNCTEEIILSKLSSRFLISDQYNRPHYSNLGYSILGRTIGEIYKNQIVGDKIYESTIEHPQIYYEKYIEHYIFKKLKMTNSTYDKSSISINNIGLSFSIDSKGNKQLINDSLSGFNSSSGGIYSTARDISKFMIFLLNGNQDVISESTRNEFLTSVSLLSNGTQAYGLPFEMYYDDKIKVWFKGKNGSLYGYKSQLTLETSLKLGAFSISFQNYEGDFTREILKILIPIYQLMINNYYHSQQQNMHQQEELKHQLSLNQHLIGQYSDIYGNSFTVKLDKDNNLVGHYKSSPKVLYSISNFIENNSEYSHIKRINILNNDSNNSSTNFSLTNGANNELIYFNLLKDKNNIITQCISLDIMNYSLKKEFNK